MKPLHFLFLSIFINILSPKMGFAQDNEKIRGIDELTEILNTGGRTEDQIKNILDGLIEEPYVYELIWKNTIKQAIHKNPNWQFLEDMNIDFKVFEAKNNLPASLGFSYNFTFDYAKYKETNRYRKRQAFTFNTKGNVAFRKEVNPTDFLVSSLSFQITNFKGGVIKQDKNTFFEKLNNIEDSLKRIDNVKELASSSLWKEFGQYLKLSNQFYYGFSGNIAFESNQTFFNKQYVFSIQNILGLKAWDTKNIMSRLNFLDFPFALIRVITKTDKHFTPKGSTLPTLLIGIDRVTPVDDLQRESLDPGLSSFFRFKLETGYRTVITNITESTIFFNANFRYFKEINAIKPIKQASLDDHLYFVASLTSSNGFFISYSYGKLPFDAINDKVYELGFKYKF